MDATKTSEWKALGPEHRPLVEEIRDSIFHAQLPKIRLRLFPRFAVKLDARLPRGAIPYVALWAPDGSACLNLAPGARHAGPAGA